MWPPLLLLSLLFAVPPGLADCSDSSATAAEVLVGFAQACSHGVRHVVQHEIRSAHNQSVQELTQSLELLLREARAVSPQCPAGWSRHLDSCYFIPPEKANWFRAHHLCAALDRRARLASVHPASGEFIEAMVAAFNAEKGVWVGLTGAGAAGGWTWTDGTPLDYANWDVHQPNGGNPSCIHLGWPGTDYVNNRFHDNACTVVINLLCQINLE